MLSPELALMIVGGVSILGLIVEYREKNKFRKQLVAARADYVTNVEVLNGIIAEKNRALATEYLAKKKVQDLLDATKQDADDAKKAMLEINDQLVNARNERDIAQSDVKDLEEEIARIHGLLGEKIAENETASQENRRLRDQIDALAVFSEKKAVKLTKKPKPKKKAK